MTNLRFPHYCRIYRKTDISPFSDGETSEVYAGICRRDASTNIRSFRTGATSIGQVNYGDFRISVPGRVEIRKGDYIDVDYGIGKECGMQIINPNYVAIPMEDTPEGATECFYNLADI